MFCVRCGRELQPESAYCAYCGVSMSQVAGPGPAPAIPPAAPLTPSRSRPRLRYALLMVGLLALPVAFGVAVGGLVWLANGKRIVEARATPACTDEAVVPMPSPVAPSQRVASEMEAVAKARRSVVLVSTADGTGSGVVLTSDGHVLTNRHVVEGARKIEVRLADGRTLPARILRTSQIPDLALLKASAAGLPPAAWADSDRLALGQTVLAIGHALDMEGEPTVSRGIVSALRTRNSVKYVQTDAALNPGSSGGPIVDLDGAVVGIDTFGIEGADAMNFAIAASEVRRWLEKCAAP